MSRCVTSLRWAAHARESACSSLFVSARRPPTLSVRVSSHDLCDAMLCHVKVLRTSEASGRADPGALDSWQMMRLAAAVCSCPLVSSLPPLLPVTLPQGLGGTLKATL